MSITEHLETLRNEYADAHRRFAKSKAELESLELRLEEMGLPKWQWHRQVVKFLAELKREWERDLRNLIRLGREVVALEGPTAAAKKAEKAEKAPVKPEREYFITQMQRVDVCISEGKTVTRFNSDAAHWIRVNSWHLAKKFKRVFVFQDKQIPPEYDYVLEHNGFRYGPTDVVNIVYGREEFKRICEREVAAQNGLALDGERMSYWRLNDEEPIGMVGEKPTES